MPNAKAQSLSGGFLRSDGSSRQSLQVGKAAQRAGSFKRGNPATGLPQLCKNDKKPTALDIKTVGKYCVPY
ncbi:MAG: hypothetical protein RMY34_16570 [Aulosira sp. DedQUE10]|nr:hypothetical protein [Aulosira sp. DedQUE10]